MQFQGKRMVQTQKNGEKLHFVSDLRPLNSKSDRHFFFPFRNLAFSVTRYHDQVSSCTISEKTNVFFNENNLKSLKSDFI